MCLYCWSTLFKVIQFLPILRDRKAVKPDSFSKSEWQVLRAFFSKHRDRLFWKGKQLSRGTSSQLNFTKAKNILYLQYTRDGDLVQDGAVSFLSKDTALERPREIHSSSSGVCKVVGLNS